MKGCLPATVALVICLSSLIILAKMRDWTMTPEQKAAERQRAAVEAEQAAAINMAEAEKYREQKQRILIARDKFLQELVKIEGVQQASIDGSGDLMKVRFAPLVHIGQDHVRVMCEGIAYKWAATAGLEFVRCESWYGNKRYAVGEYSGPIPKEHLLLVLNTTLQQMQQEKENAMPSKPQAVQAVRSPEEQADKNMEALIAMQGKTFAEIEGTHGAAITKSKETGWAEFRTFRARFENGKVSEVSVK